MIIIKILSFVIIIMIRFFENITIYCKLNILEIIINLMIYGIKVVKLSEVLAFFSGDWNRRFRIINIGYKLGCRCS